MSLRPDLQRVADWIAPRSSVLDLGCCGGQLLRYLQDEKQCRVVGVDNDDDAVLQTLEQGVNVIQLDLDEGLGMFGDASFDVVLQLNTLQQMHRVEGTLAEIARVGKQAIVSFPNFGYWSHRVQLLRGRMPVSKALPYSWFDTPNIRCATLNDFGDLAQTKGFSIEERLAITGEKTVKLLPNLLGEVALFKLRKTK